MEYDSALRLFNPQTYGGRTVHITLKEFLAKIRRNGMDIIFPQIDHDQILFCILQAFLVAEDNIVTHRQIIDFVMTIQEKKIMNFTSTVSKTKIRGVLAILKQASIFEVMESLSDEEQSATRPKQPNNSVTIAKHVPFEHVKLKLNKNILNIQGLRYQHDLYLSMFNETSAGPIVVSVVEWMNVTWSTRSLKLVEERVKQLNSNTDLIRSALRIFNIRTLESNELEFISKLTNECKIQSSLYAEETSLDDINALQVRNSGFSTRETTPPWSSTEISPSSNSSEPMTIFYSNIDEAHSNIYCGVSSKDAQYPFKESNWDTNTSMCNRRPQLKIITNEEFLADRRSEFNRFFRPQVQPTQQYLNYYECQNRFQNFIPEQVSRRNSSTSFVQSDVQKFPQIFPPSFPSPPPSISSIWIRNFEQK